MSSFSFGKKTCLAAVMAAGIFTSNLSLSNDANHQIKMTWFGVTNWYYELEGGVGILIDGAVTPGFGESDTALVERLFNAMDQGAGVNKIFIGHEHGDHASDKVAWAKLTGAMLYTTESGCESALEDGLPGNQCTPIYGGETIELTPSTDLRVVRWSHSVGCDQTSEGGTRGMETFGFLITKETPDQVLSVFMTDSGAGGAELVTNRIVEGVDYGAPLANLAKAIREADINSIEVWQGGPESRMVTQARYLLPIYDIQYFIPQHFGARGGFNITQGLHYAYDLGEMPLFESVLDEYEVELLVPVNYFDAYVYDSAGLRAIDNLEVKRAVGLPDHGPGPQAQTSNPRSGALECVGD